MSWNKYKAKKSEFDGYSFASQMERAAYQMLKLFESEGKIKIIQTQDSIYLSDAKILYKPDFKIEACDTGEIYWVEVKGFETPEWRIKRRLWIAYGPGKLQIWKGSASNLKLYEILKPEKNNG